MQSSTAFGQSVPVQLCAEQNSNKLQEKITKKKKNPLEVFCIGCWAGITAFQSVGTWMTVR